jgi:DNA-binding CsgD family transcriptional regulator
MLETAKIQIIIWPLWPGRHPSNSEGELPQLQKKPHGGDDNGSAPVAPTASATLTSINSGRDAVDLAAGSRRQPSERRLSVRESQILEIMVSGDSNKMVARKCGITEATVKVHVKSIMRKIQVTNRTQAAVWAMENSSTPRANKRLREVDTDDAA